MIVNFSIIGFPQPKVLINTFHLNVLCIIYYSCVDMVIILFDWNLYSIFYFLTVYYIVFYILYFFLLLNYLIYIFSELFYIEYP